MEDISRFIGAVRVPLQPGDAMVAIRTAFAEVGLARAAKRMGDSVRAKKGYEQFFTFWKDADSDILLLLEAGKE